MRVFTTLLCEAFNDEKELFTFEYDMPIEYKKIFEKRFFQYYRFNNIGFDSHQMFRHFLEINLNLLLPKYKKLYESEHLIINPFINYAVQSENFNRNRGKNIKYEENNSKNFNNGTNSSGGINVSREGTNTVASTASVGRTDGVVKDKEIHDSLEVDVNLYVDSPQSKVEENTFNSGYITTKNKDTQRKQDLKSNTNENVSIENSTGVNESASTADSYSDNLTQGESFNYAQKYDDNYIKTAIQNTQKSVGQEFGLKGVSVADILQQWRNTFINIDKMLIEDLADLFIRSY